jgi:hypothetical protein
MAGSWEMYITLHTYPEFSCQSSSFFHCVLCHLASLLRHHAISSPCHMGSPLPWTFSDLRQWCDRIN